MIKSWVSFDLWGTLIKSNPEYLPKRNRLAKEQLFFDVPMTAYDVGVALSKVKKKWDLIAEPAGKSIEPIHLFLDVYAELNLEIPKVDFRSRYNAWVLKHHIIMRETPPILYPEVNELLAELKSRGVFISVTCNSSTHLGIHLKSALPEIFKYTHETIFSDELGYAKPAPQVWKLLKSKAGKWGIKPEEIIHVGDNPFADGSCIYYDIDFLLVNDGNTTLKEVLNKI